MKRSPILLVFLLGWSTSAAQTSAIDSVRENEGILRSAYNIGARVRSGLTPEKAAIEHLASTPGYGIALPDEHLVLRDVKAGKYATHITFQQTFAGLPVYNREVKVNLDVHGQPTLVINGFATHLERTGEFDAEPALTTEDALGRVQFHLGLHAEATEPVLMIYPADSPRLAWKVTAWDPMGAGEWEVLIDAKTGDLLSLIDISLHSERTSIYHPTPPVPSSPRPTVPSSPRPTVDGSGLVFDPDPLTSAGVEYGGAYVDANDADIPELNAQRFEVTLRDISQGPDGLYRLEGPYVTIDGATCGQAYTPPAEASPDAFRYTRAHPWFEAVNVYYHIDKSQRYIQSLDIGFPIRERPVRANPRGMGSQDNSTWSGGCIKFGFGEVDDAEDADVILHEYGHALLDDAVPGLRSSAAGRAYHEGWGDYWAASYSRFLSEEDPQIPPHDWRKVFSWDGNAPCWNGRTLNHPGSYPNEVILYPTSGCPKFDEYYQGGMLWATTMMQIYDAVGREVMDRLHLASFGYLSSSAQWSDFAEALLQADRDLYGGLHRRAIAETLIERGFVPEGTAAEDEAPERETSLLQNYPNPFSGSTEIRIKLSGAAHVLVDVFDITGRRIRQLLAADLPPGEHEVIWDARDGTGRSMAAGVYIYRVQIDDVAHSRSMLLIR